MFTLVYVMLAEGFEEAEALTPVDLLRRAGVSVQTVGVTGKVVSGSHQIPVTADILPEQMDLDKLEMIVLPGGMPGTKNLYADETLRETILRCAKEKKYVAAICAAPSIILGGLGLLKGRRATCYPGMEDGMTGATPVKAHYVVDDRFITGCGVGGALDFSCALVEALCGKEKACQTAEKAAYRFE